MGLYLTSRSGPKDGNVIKLRRDGFVLTVAVDDHDRTAPKDSSLISWYYSRRARPGNDNLYRPGRKVNEASVVPEEFYEEIAGITGLEEPFKFICNMDLLRQDRVQNFLMRRILSDGAHFKKLAKLGFVFLGDAAHATSIVGSQGADVAIQDAMDLADVLDKTDIGTYTKEWESISFEPRKALTQEYLASTILKFYERTLLEQEGSPSWASLGEKAENVLADMHNT
jgi:hypothetical protein